MCEIQETCLHPPLAQESQTNLHSIVWLAGTAKSGCKKTKTLAVDTKKDHKIPSFTN